MNNNNINTKIMDIINEIPDKNVQDFFIEALQVEYEVRDQEKPRIKKDYEKLIEKYCRDNNDS